ncbi:MAG: helix-turn-helix transcriptional regulator [Actinoplanes sp.]
MDRSAAGSPAATYIEVLAGLRRTSGLSQKELALRMGVVPSYISHVESGRHRPTAEFTWRAEDALDGQGRLTEAFEQYWRAVHKPDTAVPLRRPQMPGAELVVEHEEAGVRLDAAGYYRVTLVRQVRNVGQRPLIRFPTRIAADAYPDDTPCSTAFYQHHPVTVDGSGFWATLNGEPTSWTMARDRPAYKKINIEFAPGGTPQPVYPGSVAELACGYTLHWSQWGDWFGREIRWPTRRLSVALTFPRKLGAHPAGQENSWTTDRDLRLDAGAEADGVAVTYRWTTVSPVLGTQYRFTWSFRRAPEHRRARPDAVHRHEQCACPVPTTATAA